MTTGTAMIRTLGQTADELNVKPHRIQYLIRREYFRPKPENVLGLQYGFDEEDLAELKTLLSKVGKRARRRPGRLKFLRDKDSKTENGTASA